MLPNEWRNFQRYFTLSRIKRVITPADYKRRSRFLFTYEWASPFGSKNQPLMCKPELVIIPEKNQIFSKFRTSFKSWFESNPKTKNLSFLIRSKIECRIIPFSRLIRINLKIILSSYWLMVKTTKIINKIAFDDIWDQNFYSLDINTRFFGLHMNFRVKITIFDTGSASLHELFSTFKRRISTLTARKYILHFIFIKLLQYQYIASA